MTTVYSKGLESGLPQGFLGATPVRTSSVPDVPPPPMSRPSAPIPTQPSLQPPLPNQTLPSTPAVRDIPFTESPVSFGPGPKTNRTPLVLAAIVALAIAAGLFFLLRPSEGGLVVTVAGSGGQRLDAVEVLVDGDVRCTTSPCRLQELNAGTHMVRARADGYQETADNAVVVSSGQDAVHNIKLVRASGTGVRVSGEGPGLKLYVDGREVGPLPQEVKDLSPGEHVVKVDGDHFEAWQQTITVSSNEMQTIGPLRLKVVKGLAQIRAGSGASGARVVIEVGDDRRSLPDLPTNLHIDTSKQHRLIAEKKGYETFSELLTFEDGVAEKEIVINLEPEEDSSSSSGRWRPPPGGRSPSPSPAPAPETPTGQATLSINSIPPSNVILDGRPIGKTPKIGVSVSPGSHTVIFVNEGERKAKSVKVGAGEKQTVVHRFK